MSIENKNYKDTVFRMLFNNKVRLLELYNAINGTSYHNPDDLTITTLNGETFLKMKNDLSFIINFELNLFEHQSTPCPNIPLRDLYYLAANLKEIYPTEKIYSTSMLQIPAPRFFMFYNGTTSMNDKVIYRLSDMFIHHMDSPSVELIVTALNVNNGHNKELMEACEALKGYSLFVEKVRKYKQEAEAEYDSSHSTPLRLLVDNQKVMKKLISKSVSKAIDDCIQEDILQDFFNEYRKEIIEVGVLEYSYERHMQMLQDESYDAGINNTNALYSWLDSEGRQADIIKAIHDRDFLSKLFEEYSNRNS
ncbi:hypothetical protein SAMN02745229_01282 [Butyrivibrio fibrisolvens DSM 3071]|uniref:Transposase, YhgA-like n=1 Tax=Butyrivibrio fibrisolvens DSM 3071 TaxID=1121131 RepID=A0A1M5X4A8_BUTFI|nr:hypothetical protein [Butyrivibrio fibrisolvens]SHH94647.1 hypothetical protein SAMN02745229_01282 [Butyrivibrio fibrisolvens DSM 3071]